MIISIGFVRSAGQVLIKELDCLQNSLNSKIIDVTDLADENLQGLFIDDNEHFNSLVSILEKEKSFYPILEAQSENLTLGTFESMPAQAFKDLFQKITARWCMQQNFTSLEKIVNTVGGIEVDSEYNFSSGGYSFAAGKNQLDGKQALAFSRERYSFEGGDRTRGQNQMRVLTALIGKISQPSVIVNYQSILNSLGGIMQTNMTSDDMTTLIRNQLDSMAKWNISSISVDGNGASQPTYSMGAQNLYVMIPDEASLTSAKNKINSVLR
jgi:hypothetical protein